MKPYVREFNNGSSLILYSSEKSQDNSPMYNRGLILFSESNLDLSMVYGTVELALSKNGMVIQNSDGDGFVFNVKGRSLLSTQNINKTSYQNWEGYGLSIINGYWEIQSETETDDVYKFLSANSLLTKVDTSHERIESEECTSGGCGATECSIDEVLGVGCSVTCSNGYYACCISSTTRCICKSANECDPEQ